MRPHVFNFAPSTASTTGYASNVTGAGPWTMTTTAAPDGYAHRVTIHNDSATDHSGKTVTLVGTDVLGNALTEVVTAPGSNATATSTGYFASLTTATPSATIGLDTFDFGYAAQIQSIVYPIDWRARNTCNIHAVVGGTINYTVAETYANVLAGNTPAWTDISAFSGKTATVAGSATIGAMAIRITVASYSAGATLDVYTSQPVGAY